MRVSQVWRQVAASSKIIFSKKKHFDDLERTRNLLSNSGDQPLDVHIKASTTDIEFGTHTANLLREHVSRFQSLVIRAPTYETAETLFSSIGEGKPAPLLERLDIHRYYIHPDQDNEEYDPPFDTPGLSDSFYPCPRLRQLTIPGMPLPLITSPHFKGLTSLTIDATPFFYGMDLETIMAILDSNKDLRHFAYFGQDVFNYWRIESPIISMPHLTSADISAPGCGLSILCNVDAPNLTKVRFNGWRSEIVREEWVDSLTVLISEGLRLLSKRSPNLTHLELRSTVMHEPNVDYEWLMSDNAFPRLEVLRLYDADIEDTTLILGSGRMGSLKRLELLACTAVSGNGILKFVERRNQDFELLIDACPGVNSNDLIELKEQVKVL